MSNLKAESSARITKVSKTSLVETLRDQSKGRFVTITFKKNDGTERTINGKVSKTNFLDSLGYIKFLEKGKEYKLVNPRELKSACINKVHYKTK